jgi:hypothetical protein
LEEFLQTNGTITRNVYFRTLAVGGVDAFVFLLAGIFETVFFALDVHYSYEGTSNKFPFYSGWAYIHTGWAPLQISYSDVVGLGPRAAWILSVFYINEWIPVLVGFSVFALFGTTQEARQMYSRPFIVACALGWKPQAAYQCQIKPPSVKFTPPQSNPSCSTCSTDEEQRFAIWDKIQ